MCMNYVWKTELAFLLVERGMKTKGLIQSYFAIQCRLANCRTAQLALARCLRGLVHRDVIPQVADAVWSTRRDARWKIDGHI